MEAVRELCLPAGRKYEACLTPSQWGTLFGKRKSPRKLGCGQFACVYQSRDEGKVVKLTTDPGDVQTTREAQGIPHVVTLYRAFNLAPRRYAMVLERLTPLRERERNFWRGALICAVDMDSPDLCCHPKKFSGERNACRRLIGAVQDTEKRLAMRGLFFSDWHAGNIGRDVHGNWKLLDLGFNVDYVDPPLRALAGGRLRRRS